MESDFGIPSLLGMVEEVAGGEKEEGEPPDVQANLADFREQWKRELQNRGQNKQLNREELEKEAKKLFMMGSRLEQEGALYEAVSYYRRALHLVPDIEMRIDFLTRSPRDRQESESSVDSYDGEEMDSDLVRKFENLDMDEKKLCSREFLQTKLLSECQTDWILMRRRVTRCLIWIQTVCKELALSLPIQACHISALPVEVLIYIFKWVVTAQLDMKSLENLSQVCRGFYLCARDEELWRLACQRVWGTNTSKVTKYGSWRTMYIERPHVQYLGCYISKMRYYRPGEKGLDNFYTPWHDVVYYRFIHFFSEGTVLMMTSPEDPQTTIPKLKNHNHKVAGMLKGLFKVQGRKVSAVLHRVKIPEKNPYFRARRNKNQVNSNESQQTFHMELELSSIGKRNGARLNWISYSVRTFNRSGEENISEFELDNKSYPPLIYSRVRSYAYDADTPLML